MFRLAVAILLSLIFLTSAKNINLPEFQDNEIDSIYDDNEGDFSFGDSYSSEEKLWALDIKDEDWSSLKLRVGTAEEEDDFNYFIGPLIDRYNIRHSTVVKKDASRPAKTQSEETDAITIKKNNEKQNFDEKEDIFKIINKFALTTNFEPDSYLNESDVEEGQSIALHFRGTFTALIVKLGIKQWHYFIPPPSRLPSWFYVDHTKEAIANYVEIPNEVKDELSTKLLHIMQTFLGHPV